MSQSSPPALTVRTYQSRRTFAPASEIVVGRDLRADIRVVHALVSRVHVVLRFERGRWVAFDNGSRNGTYVDGHRVSAVDLHDGQSIFLGDPETGFVLTFEIGRQTGPVGAPPRSTRERVSREARPPGYPPSPPQRAHPPNRPMAAPSGPHPMPVARQSQPVGYVAPPTQRLVPTNAINAVGPDTHQATGFGRSVSVADGPRPTKAITIGRDANNDIIIADFLVSRLHATLLPTESGTEIQDERSSNGTFVNGVRVTRAFLGDGDTVTIGNIDLVFEGGTLVRRSEPEVATATGGLEVRGITWTIDGNKKLLDNISMTARLGSLTAVIGPSGAGKSTFSRLIAGSTYPTSGTASFEGHNIHSEYASLRSRIGMVPQDDVVHGELTVNQALTYAAELRLPPDTTKADRAQVVAQVLEELEMTKHADTRVDKLSGGQRKRASVALELLTGPSLLILDEPTSGLDPALDRQVMTMLRDLADAGRVVLVVTHSLSFLDVCDQVLLLAPGGKTAFLGAPNEIGSAMGTTNWADIFSTVASDPDGVHRRYLDRHGSDGPPPPAVAPKDLGSPTRTSLWGQFSTCVRRQVRLLLADRGYFIFLAVLPFIMGLLSITVPGNARWHIPDPNGSSLNEAMTVLVLLNVGAIFMGTALTIRTLIGERPIFVRERAVGLSTNAYLLAKMTVFTVFAVLQATVAVGITIVGKGIPTRGAVVLGNAGIELWFDITFTCVAAAMVGLALSALAKSSEQIMPLLVVAIMSQLVFSGGMIAITDRIGLDQLSWITPARWGYALSGSTVDILKLALSPDSPQDSHWRHTPTAWLFDFAMLTVVSIGYVAFVRWQIRLKSK